MSPAATKTTASPPEWPQFLAALRRARARLSEDPTARLSLAQYLLVAPLLDAPGRSVGELAAHAGVASPTATRMLDALERDGHVRRVPGERQQAARLLGRLAELMEEL